MSGVTGRVIDTLPTQPQDTEVSATAVDDDDAELDPAEFIFLIDLSGSMYHSRKSRGGQGAIVLAQAALRLFLHSLPEESKFNIIQFGSSFRSTFEQSVEYNEETLKRALDDVNTYHERDRRLGGTEIYTPLKHIFDQKADQKLLK